MPEYSYDKDPEGIVTVTFDAEGRSANTMTFAWFDAMDEINTRLQSEDDLRGVVLASAKKTFFAGGDLTYMSNPALSSEQAVDYVERIKAPLRVLEKLPVPVVAAINGTALGGGYEICLACNHRIVFYDPKTVVGLPEVALGILPGGGGTCRLSALLGIGAALPYLIEGTRLSPQKALGAGLVDATVGSISDLIPAAKAWIRAHPSVTVMPWDRDGFAVAPADKALDQALDAIKAKTRGLMPAPEKIIEFVKTLPDLPFDTALRKESDVLAELLCSPEARAAIKSFFDLQAVRSGKLRPEGAQQEIRKASVIGAGMMGRGIAWAQASSGLETVLKARSSEKAESGKAYSAKIADKQIARGRMTESDKALMLDRIIATDSYEAISGSDLIIESVPEDIDLKQPVIAESFDCLTEQGIFATNTSSLPISVLADFCPDPTRFVGLHFFSPVEHMKLVEIVRGKRTSQDTLRRAYDYVRQIGYLPIVVNDNRGFFTSRVFATYLDEGLALLQDGILPDAIEQSAWAAGMPIGPLAVHDEISLSLTKTSWETHAALDARLGEVSGYGADNHATRDVVTAMLSSGRAGRKAGAGFYDYRADGTKSLWAGLAQFRKADRLIPEQDARDRLLFRQAIEALRCFDEGVLNSEAEANIGSTEAIGFPRHTGGVLQFVRGYGREAFLSRSQDLAQSYGTRFALQSEAVDKLFA